jgi:ATP-dependent Clp protease ATP-binding subunit ClpC
VHRAAARPYSSNVSLITAKERAVGPLGTTALSCGNVFERFTDRAGKAVVLAQEEARMLGNDYIGSEHLLLGLIHEGGGVAAKALDRMGVSLEQVRRDVTAIVGSSARPAPQGHIPFTPKAKKVMELSLREAIGLGHNYIGTEHILLALVRQGDGVAAGVLREHGLGLERVRDTVVELLTANQPMAAVEGVTEPTTEYEASQPAPEAEPVERRSPTCPSCSARLGEWLRTRAIDAEGDVPSVTIAYCGRCGVAIGTIA